MQAECILRDELGRDTRNLITLPLSRDEKGVRAIRGKPSTGQSGHSIDSQVMAKMACANKNARRDQILVLTKCIT
ncbi:MAG: hypothetical protein DWH81_14890 [Planctomycetota bacterium]|nr:MAG: hypothetical protein DWH81_14890 [Planctomycetota bacterium]